MKELILITCLLGSHLVYSKSLSQRTEPVLRVLDTGEIVKVTKSQMNTQSIQSTGLNIYSDSVSELIDYTEALQNQKLSNSKKKALILQLFAEPN